MLICLSIAALFVCPNAPCSMLLERYYLNLRAIQLKGKELGAFQIYIVLEKKRNKRRKLAQKFILLPLVWPQYPFVRAHSLFFSLKYTTSIAFL